MAGGGIGDRHMQAEVDLSKSATHEALSSSYRSRLESIMAWQNEINLSVLSLSAGEETLPQLRHLLARLAPRRRIR